MTVAVLPADGALEDWATPLIHTPCPAHRRSAGHDYKTVKTFLDNAMTDWNAPLRFPDGRVWDVLEARVCEEEDERRCDFEVQERQRQIYRHFILIVRESAIRRGDFADDTEVLCFARHWVASHLSSNAQELAYSRCCRAVIGECE